MGSDQPAERATMLDARSGLSHDAIRQQLDRILAHREFQATDKMREFLRFVVEETLAGRRHHLKGHTVATRVFGRGSDFDAGQDPIVSIQAGRLRRALERYYLVAGGRDPIHVDIPKGGYVPRFAAQDVKPDTGRRGGRAAEGAKPLPSVGPSVAVLPLENLTDDPEQTALTIGLTQELVTEMNRFQDIIVIPCRWADHTAGSPAGPLGSGTAEGARFLLTGTVRRDTETVKVSMQLTDAENRRQIWAEAYTHPLEASRLIATQEAIASSVVAAIASEYGIIARRLAAEARKKPPAELDTYEAMLRYYSHQITPTPESARACFVALQRAVKIEPAYGPAWSALATLQCQMYSMDVPGFEQPLETAIEHARRGVSLEPGSQLGRLILAYVSYVADDTESFRPEIETALALNPNSPYTVGTAGYFHVMRGEFERGLPLLDRAIAMNPCHPDWFHAAYVVDHLHRHDYDRGLLELEKYQPFQSYWTPVAFAAILGKLGRIAEARVHVKQVKTQKPDFPSRAHELLRRTVKIDALIDDVLDGLRRAGMSR